MAEILAAVRSQTAPADGAVLPSVSEMVAALRRLDAERVGRNRRPEPTGFAAALRRWFGVADDTHHGASI